MPFMNSIGTRLRRASSGGGGETGDGDGMFPIIGVADWNSPRTSATINSLRNVQRGVNPSRVIQAMSVQIDGNDGLFIAYPKIYGLAAFKEQTRSGSAPPYTYTDSWDITMDGAGGNPIDGPYGPQEVDVVIDGVSIPMYVYVNDWPGIGLFHFRSY